MKNLSLRLDENIFNKSEKLLLRLKKNRNQYINDAIYHYNLMIEKTILEDDFKKASEIVKNNSLKVLKEFEDFEYEN